MTGSLAVAADVAVPREALKHSKAAIRLIANDVVPQTTPVNSGPSSDSPSAFPSPLGTVLPALPERVTCPRHNVCAPESTSARAQIALGPFSAAASTTSYCTHARARRPPRLSTLARAACVAWWRSSARVRAGRTIAAWRRGCHGMWGRLRSSAIARTGTGSASLDRCDRGAKLSTGIAPHCGQFDFSAFPASQSASSPVS
ncbi:hypothetical protein WOLCODRAFT_150528 [Wolfiporia cocos MD-104 SS10]|uniref:Uncharacterized protein n=1 Tax=Wolfiporia cocos (strain MD-104) TaxID=742152 RepID=A0A2H3JE53_WOLCO|nr:hypothetical protein WOLCODRAFT_150528 [Wolfiporia cocos MD-104 SS10]